jgi:hypothetical protein
MVVYEQFNIRWRIERSELASILSDALMNDVKWYSPELDDESNDQSYSGFAHMLLRKLQGCGWIENESDETGFKQYVMIPDYAIMMMETVAKIISEKPVEYNSYVFSTYSSLKTADTGKEEYYRALMVASKDTKDLRSKLLILHNNIKRYHTQLAGHEEVKDIVVDHFDKFKKMVADVIYHPLKTIDSVPRFRTPILEILNNWLDDEDILDAILDEGIRRERFKEGDYPEVIRIISQIIEVYEEIEDILKAIDQKNTAYTRATVERIQYMLNADGSLKGRIASLVKEMRGAICDDFELNLTTVKELDETSLYSRKRAIRTIGAKVLLLPDEMMAQDIEKELQGLKKQMASTYTRKRIAAYIEELLADSEERHIDEIDIDKDEAFIRLLLATLQHDDRDSTYTVKYNEGQVLKDNWCVPNLSLHRRR